MWLLVGVASFFDVFENNSSPMRGTQISVAGVLLYGPPNQISAVKPLRGVSAFCSLICLFVIMFLHSPTGQLVWSSKMSGCWWSREAVHTPWNFQLVVTWWTGAPFCIQSFPFWNAWGYLTPLPRSRKRRVVERKWDLKFEQTTNVFVIVRGLFATGSSSL